MDARQNDGEDAKFRDCRDCLHNSYLAIDAGEWFSCSHPITLARGPHWQKGDPAMVNWRTGDVRSAEISAFADCPTWEPVAALKATGG